MVAAHKLSGPMNSGSVRGLFSRFLTLKSVRTFLHVFWIEPAEYPAEMWAKVLRGKSDFNRPPFYSMNCLHISLLVV